MLRLKRFKWSVLVIILQFIVMGYFLSILPADAKIPIHWNIHNEIDGWTTKTNAALFNVGVSLGLFLLMFLMPYYSPWYRRYSKRNENFIPTITFILLLFLALINLYCLYIAARGKEPAIKLIQVLIGLLFIFLGNLLPKAPRNFFVGIRTPWTLANEEVWIKTHRLGGWMFVFSGLIMVLNGFILTANKTLQEISGIFALVILLYPVLYSFLIFRKLENRNPK